MKRLLALSLCALLLAGVVPVSASAQIDPDAVAAACAPCAAVVDRLNCEEKGRELMELFLPAVVSYLANTLQSMDGREADALALRELFAGLTQEQRDNLADYVMERYREDFPHRVSHEELFVYFGTVVYEWYATVGQNLAVLEMADQIKALSDALDESMEALEREAEAAFAS